MPTELVKLSQKELKHHEVIRKAFDGKYTNRQAAEELNLTVRQVQRLKIRVKEMERKIWFTRAEEKLERKN